VGRRRCPVCDTNGVGDPDRSKDPVFAAALAELRTEDPSAASDAEAALEWIAGENGPDAITQERIQHFLWYSLPLKWLTKIDHRLSVAAALGRALDLLGLPRYAEICRSETTRVILRTYEQDADRGFKAFDRADVASGIRPPDLPELEWGSTMGWEESRALSSTAELLELAVAGGDVIPGTRGWKVRQQELARRHLNESRPDLAGQSFAQVILTERTQAWLESRRSETRRGILSPIANRLLRPVELPSGATDPLPPLRWLLEQLAGGIALTQTGNLNQRFVQSAAERFGWNFSRPPRTEDDLYDLHQVRSLAQRHGLARRSGHKLVLTAKGRGLLADREGLWRSVARGLVGVRSFGVFVGELFLALLVDVESMLYHDLTKTIGEAVAEEGFRETRTGELPSEHDVSRGIHATLNPCRALGILAENGTWRDRRYGLTTAGKVTALEALRARATGPRPSPWD